MAQSLQRDWDKITADLLLETMQAKRIQKGIFRMLKEKKLSIQNSQPAQYKQTSPKSHQRKENNKNKNRDQRH